MDSLHAVAATAATTGGLPREPRPSHAPPPQAHASRRDDSPSAIALPPHLRLSPPRTVKQEGRRWVPAAVCADWRFTDRDDHQTTKPSQLTSGQAPAGLTLEECQTEAPPPAAQSPIRRVPRAARTARYIFLFLTTSGSKV